MITCVVEYVIDPAQIEAFEEYRTLFGHDPEFVEADRIRDESGCVLRYDRTFLRPVFN